MGVYIKGMEMPKEGNWKTVRIYPDGTCAVPNWQGDCMLLKGAQAAELPPHGRLIDADALLMRINHEVMEAYMDGVCYGVHPSQEYLYLLGEIIDDAPTIIEAEGRE